jgi:hypothetical protein
MTDKLNSQQNADKANPRKDNIHLGDPPSNGPMKTEAKNTMPILERVSARSLSCVSESRISFYFILLYHFRKSCQFHL